ncbi:hypothetical protein [Mycobacterium camsae]|uniref:hypothetical protein n=1 Tax=Mycobacterium gordonae TaxID=1778 RepID=UPI0019804CB3|nr:hypothetical protein [Mycobacterium gordonae]
MATIATQPLRSDRPAENTNSNDFNVVGIAVAAIWAIGLVVGIIALVTGQLGVALVALSIAVVAPLFGLAWTRLSGSFRPSFDRMDQQRFH